MPLVSVVIPAYNCARTLPSAVAGVLAQTAPDLEVVIVDDGSKDETLAAARGIPDRRVRVLSQANGGAASARNAGIRAASGKYVAFLDGDDLWLPHKLERQLEVLEGNRGISAVQCGAIYVDDDLGVLSVRPCAPSRDPLLETLLFRNLPACMSTLVVARRKLDEIGPIDAGLGILEDWDLMIRVSRHCGLVSLEGPLALYRQHPGNRSRDLSIHVGPGLLVLGRLFADPGLPDRIRRRRRRIYARFYAMLAGGSLRGGDWAGLLKWGLKGASTHPSCLGYMAALPLRRLVRRRSRRSAPASHFPDPAAVARPKGAIA